LEDSSIAKIKLEGLSFFANVTESRGSGNNNKKYKEWSETPYTNDLPIPVWGCGMDFDLANEISNKIETKGNFYTSTLSGDGILVVIPSLKYAFYTYK
jgi:hypothetical protein